MVKFARLKKRTGIALSKRHGEANSLYKVAVNNWGLKSIDHFKNIDPNYVFNGN